MSIADGSLHSLGASCSFGNNIMKLVRLLFAKHVPINKSHVRLSLNFGIMISAQLNDVLCEVEAFGRKGQMCSQLPGSDEGNTAKTSARRRIKHMKQSWLKLLREKPSLQTVLIIFLSLINLQHNICLLNGSNRTSILNSWTSLLWFFFSITTTLAWPYSRSLIVDSVIGYE